MPDQTTIKCASPAMTAAGSARTIRTSHGMARTPLAAAALAHPALAATPQPPTSRRACRQGSSRMVSNGG